VLVVEANKRLKIAFPGSERPCGSSDGKSGPTRFARRRARVRRALEGAPEASLVDDATRGLGEICRELVTRRAAIGLLAAPPADAPVGPWTPQAPARAVRRSFGERQDDRSRTRSGISTGRAWPGSRTASSGSAAEARYGLLYAPNSTSTSTRVMRRLLMKSPRAGSPRARDPRDES